MPISAAFPFASRYVNVEGARIHYIEQGSGDPILEAWGVPSLFASKDVIVLKGSERLKAADRER